MPVPKGKAGVTKVMDEWEAHRLHSGSKAGPLVTTYKQARAIALSQAFGERRKKRKGK